MPAVQDLDLCHMVMCHAFSGKKSPFARPRLALWQTLSQGQANNLCLALFQDQPKSNNSLPLGLLDLQGSFKQLPFGFFQFDLAPFLVQLLKVSQAQVQRLGLC